MKDNSNELIDLFMRFEWLYRRFYFQNQRHLGPMADPRRGQGRVLALLMLKPEVSQKELSNILDIRSQSLGELLSKLEKAGYITRSVSKKDRRVMMIKLTETGKKVAKEMEKRPEEVHPFACLNEDEQSQMAEYMKRVVAEMEKQCGPYDKNTQRQRNRHSFGFGREGGGFDGRHGHNHGFPGGFPHSPHPTPPYPANQKPHDDSEF